MENLEKEILIVLLNALYENGLVSGEMKDKAETVIWGISRKWDWFEKSDT